MAMLKLCPYCGIKMNYNDKDCKNKCKSKNTKQRVKRYDKNIRNSNSNKKHTQFYNSKEWKRIREYVMNEYNGLCLYSLIVHNEIVKADLVHHINEIKDSWEDRLELNNLVPLCHSRHNELHSDYGEEQVKQLERAVKKYKELYIN